MGSESEQHKILSSLPEPKEPIVVAVYKFRDQTGQYKETEVGSSWSTAITQGATSILLRSLEESKWFIPIEREGLNNLLNERKIIRSSREGYSNPNNQQPLIPPLLYGGILLEGGVISFDSNIMTGGAGARYFGTGASGQYRVDRITIYLRAVSTSNGRILKTVYTSKTIMSQQVDVGVFRFVNFRRLLEAETGFTYNEPSEMAIREAIEKAVISLIIEGAYDNLWQFKNQDDLNHPLVKNYNTEKEENQLTDVFGATIREQRGHTAIGLHGSGFYYLGDISGAKFFPGFGASAEVFANTRYSLAVGLNYGKIGTKDYYRATFLASEVSLLHRWYPRMSSTPLISIGLGSYSEFQNNQEDIKPLDKVYPYLVTSIGYEKVIKQDYALYLGAAYRYTFTDRLDYIKRGRFTDAFLDVQLGLKYFLRPKSIRQ